MTYVQYMPEWFKKVRWWLLYTSSSDINSRSATIRRNVAEWLLSKVVWITPPVERMAYLEFLEAYRESRISGYKATRQILQNRLDKMKSRMEQAVEGSNK